MMVSVQPDVAQYVRSANLKNPVTSQTDQYARSYPTYSRTISPYLLELQSTLLDTTIKARESDIALLRFLLAFNPGILVGGD
jgi:hypothetical protein